MPKLALVIGPRVVPVVRGGLTIGTAAECAVRLDDPHVAPLHAALEWAHGQLWLVHRGVGASPTRLRGRAITQATRVSSGDTFTIGAVTIRVEDATSTTARAEIETTPRREVSLAHLTEREVRVLRMIASGSTYADIAKALGVSARTIEGYRARLADKLAAPTRADLVRCALEGGIVARRA